jgi:hypothetical protein
MGNIIHKAAALDPRYHSLKYLSEEENTNTWALLEQELQNEADVTFNENGKRPSTSECSVKKVKNKVDKPCNKEKQKSHSLLADSDDEDDHDKDEDIANDCVQQLKRYSLKKMFQKILTPYFGGKLMNTNFLKLPSWQKGI